MQLADGDRAEVYLARKPGSEEYFALRLSKKPGATFQKNILRLRHENIVDVIDVGEAREPEPRAYLVQEYVPGASLTGLREGTPPLSNAVALRVVVDALFGLHALHEHARLVHRDFSARSIMVGTDGVGRLVVGVDPDVTRGLASEETLAADLRMAGIVVWEILAGHPLDGPEPPRLRTVRKDISAKLDNVVARALSLDRDDRVADARRFGEELASAAAATNMLAERAEVIAFVELRTLPLLRERRRLLDEARRDAKQRPPSMPDVRTLIGTPGPPTLKRAPLPSLPEAPASTTGPSELRLAVNVDAGERADSDLIDVGEPAVPPAPDTEPQVFRSPVVVDGPPLLHRLGFGKLSRSGKLSVACAAGGLVLGFVVVLAAVRRRPAEEPNRLLALSASSASSVSSPATAIVASAELSPPPPPPPPSPPPEAPAPSAEQDPGEPTLEVTANARIASLKIGEREVDAVVPAPSIAVELGPDEAGAALVVSAVATDGRRATARTPPGGRTVNLTFAEKPAGKQRAIGNGSAGGKKPKRK